jgi:hypothetical protein
MGFAVTTYSPSVVGLLSAQVASNQELLDLNSGQTTLGVNENRYSQFLEPCEVMDGKVIDFLNDINTDKNSIVSLGDFSNFSTHPKYYELKSEANNATQNIFGSVLTSTEEMSNLNFSSLDVKSSTTFSAGVAVSSASGGSGVVAITTTSSVGVAFSVIVKSVSESFGIGATVYLGSPGVAFTGLSSLNYVGTGKIYPDTTIITYYPDLEPANPSVQNPFGNEQFRVLNNSKKGLGVANTFYSNSLSGGSIVNSNDTISQLGEVFAFDTISGSSVKSSIDSLVSNIGINRSGITSYNNGSSTIKGYKKGYSVNIWSLKNSNVNLQNDINAKQAAIQILNDPANGGPY